MKKDPLVNGKTWFTHQFLNVKKEKIPYNEITEEEKAFFLNLQKKRIVLEQDERFSFKDLYLYTVLKVHRQCELSRTGNSMVSKIDYQVERKVRKEED